MTDPRSAGVDSKGPIEWLARNPIAANLLMVVLLLGGLISTRDVRQEVFPEITREMVRVHVSYPGASPDEVEQGAVLAIEEAIRAVDGVEEIRSRASEGGGVVTADLLRGANVQQALNDIKSEVDRVTTFPADVERPVITIPSNRQQVISVIIHGDQPRSTLKSLAEDARRALLSNHEISVVEVLGVPPPEISIEVPQESLRRYRLTLDGIAAAVARASVDMPGGAIRTHSGEILIRTTERRQEGEQFRNVVIKSNPDGSKVTVGEVATIRDAYRETDEAAFFDGVPAVRLEIFRVGDQTPLDVAKIVKDFVSGRDGAVPGVSYTIWNDQSEIYESRMNLLLDNALLGFLFVLAVLGLFLQPRLAFWVTLGIPISFLGAILLMPAMDVSVNMISLFAFLLALGIVVDDAIVVGESVHAERRKTTDPIRAAILGTRRVAVPVVFAVLTTVVAFTPMLFLPDDTGKLFSNIPLIVIPILLISLVEALGILPAHLAHSKRESAGWMARFEATQDRFSVWFERIVDTHYRRIIASLVANRYLTVAVGAGVLLLTGSLVASGLVRFNYMPKIEGDQVAVTVQMPFGTRVEETQRAAELIAEAGREVLRTEAEDISTGMYMHIGTVVTGGGPEGTRTRTGGHLASIVMGLVPLDQRQATSRDLAARWRKRVGDIAGPERISVQFAVGPGSDASFQIELRHPDRGTLRRAAADMANVFSSYQGVHDIDDGFEEGKPQFDVTLKPAARALGVTERDLARQLRSAFYGAEAQRDQRGSDELRVFVRRPRHERESLFHLERFLVRTPEGGEVPLRLAADLKRGESYTLIERENASRAVDVSAEVDVEVTTPTDLMRDIEKKTIPRLLEEYPGLTWEKSGQQMRQERSFAALSTGLVVALLIMFSLLALAFRSYVQPVIILLAIPFGMVGAVGGHLLMGYDLSVVSVLGIVALSGVVVNDSLVLVAAANDYRRSGLAARPAVVEAGVRRFRAVLLTSLTTFVGLAPIMLETSLQARFLIPMALSLGFGVLFVTFIALGLVPALFAIVDDLAPAREG